MKGSYGIAHAHLPTWKETTFLHVLPSLHRSSLPTRKVTLYRARQLRLPTAHELRSPMRRSGRPSATHLFQVTPIHATGRRNSSARPGRHAGKPRVRITAPLRVRFPLRLSPNPHTHGRPGPFTRAGRHGRPRRRPAPDVQPHTTSRIVLTGGGGKSPRPARAHSAPPWPAHTGRGPRGPPTLPRRAPTMCRPPGAAGGFGFG